jgi:hypothetical protein
MELVEGKLFVGPVKARCGWLWHSDKIGNRMEAILGIDWVSLWKE